MAKRIILHAGFPKTGTSSIQQFCTTNGGLLAARGLFYPRMPTHPDRPRPLVNHAAAFVALSPRLPARLGHELEWSRAILDDACRSFAASPQARMIISHEILAGRDGIDGDALRAVAGAADLKYLVYLRRQDDWLESRVAQGLRAAKTGMRVPRKSRWANVENSRFLPALIAARAALPGAEFVVRSFDAVKSGTLLEDFLMACGTPLDDDLATAIANEPRRNSGHPALQTLFALYAYFVDDAPDAGDAVKRAFGRRRREGAPLPLDGSSFALVPYDIREKARLAYNQDLPELRRTFGFEAAEAQPGAAAPRRAELTQTEYLAMVDYLAPALPARAERRLRRSYDRAQAQFA